MSSSVSKAISGVISSVKLFLTPHKQLPQPGSQFLVPTSGRAMLWAFQAGLCLMPSFGTMQDPQ